MSKFKVMVVDDERLARESLKIIVDWEKHGCYIIGEAANAIEAIEKAKKLRPDIIVTDIKMPGMDGLDMIENIMTFNPCNFIVVTGYDDFEYAKRAVKIRAMDFILKPIDTKEFENAVQKVVSESRKIIESEAIATEKLLLDILRGRKSPDVLKDKENFYDMQLGNLCIVLIQNDNFEEPSLYRQISTLYNQNQMIVKNIKEILGDKFHLVECHDDRFVVIVIDETLMFHQLHKMLKKLQQEVKKCAKTTLSIGISKENNIDNIKTAYDQSKIALQNRLYAGKGSITFFKNIENKGNTDIKFKDTIKNELVFMLKARDSKRLDKFLENLYLNILKNKKTNIYLIKQMSLEMIGAAIDILKTYNIDTKEVLGQDFIPYKTMRSLNTIDEIYIFMRDILMTVIMAIRESVVDISESGIKEALDYINQNYAENITLHDVANHVHHNESYLSRKLKKALGMSFVQYLTKLRMERAIELLKDPNILIQEVAQQLGYSDYRYFSSIFRKHTGYSPREFSKR